MEIFKIVAIGLVGTILAIILKQYKSEYAIYISIITGIIIIMYMVTDITSIVRLINGLINKSSINTAFISLLLKITGIAILVEFASSICIDSGETSIAKKIDMAGRIVIISMSIPIISVLLETVLKILP